MLRYGCFAMFSLMFAACAPSINGVKPASIGQPALSSSAGCNVPGQVRWQSSQAAMDFGSGCADGARVTAAVTLPVSGTADIYRVIPAPGSSVVKLSGSVDGGSVNAQIIVNGVLAAGQDPPSGQVSISAPSAVPGEVKVVFNVRGAAGAKVTLRDMFVSIEKQH